MTLTCRLPGPASLDRSIIHPRRLLGLLSLFDVYDIALFQGVLFGR